MVVPGSGLEQDGGLWEQVVVNKFGDLDGLGAGWRGAVSILIRPFDRMLRLGACRPGGCPLCVSILIRPFDRMLPYCLTQSVPSYLFQSSSGPSTGCCTDSRDAHGIASYACFNPHPALRPDAASAGARSFAGTCCFNPHPALRPDAAGGS